MRIAALGGVGIAQLLRLAVADDLAAGRLAEIFPHDPLASVPVQALHAFGRLAPLRVRLFTDFLADRLAAHSARSEEHTSELQSLMRISYAVFCLKKKKQEQETTYQT